MAQSSFKKLNQFKNTTSFLPKTDISATTYPFLAIMKPMQIAN